MTHPYSIYIWQSPLAPYLKGHWDDPVQCATQQWALHIAGLMYQNSHAVIKVVRYGINIQCFPDAHTVELVDRQIAQQRKRYVNVELQPRDQKRH